MKTKALRRYKIRTVLKDGKVNYELYDTVDKESSIIDENFSRVEQMRKDLEREVA
jgi:hypothetical protein